MTIEVESTQVAEIFEKDINKLCEDINAIIEAHNKLVDKKVELENIIKEVREYIINNSYESGDTSSMYLIDVDKLLEILEKEEK